ncbi:hypothetical protein OM076_12515 [Solirubrobacter ginsenosidimutans]|uniref:Uncharacterized protein n=1 Tax=Solirubrobacter ginsenosidimutans TaxID=490573 RepID=A0A9X3MRA2_9ACTN|nr:hypothetical protein [Solirubrobacter ginsenosidimutans]MDA0161094.1 hypothetical protein [Solirubrobacter ginsenosidimutans]
MKRLLALLVVPAVALVPSTAEGHSRAKVYKGTLALVGADGDYVTGRFGNVQLVDNKRNDKLSVHVRQLRAKATYTYRLQEGTCKAGAPGGTDVAGFKYKPLRTNRKGVGNSTARSRTFSAKRGAKYRVVVYAGGDVALCAQLRTNWWHGKPKPKADKPKPKADKPKPKGDAKQRGKRDDAPGRNQDKPRGKPGR